MLIAVLVPVAVLAVLVIGVGGAKSGGSKSPATMVSMASAKSRAPVDLPLTAKTAAHYPLAKAVAGIDGSVTAKGMLPLRSCKLTNATTVTCLQPTPAVDIVIFRSYRSLPALYAAYEARVSQLAQGPFRSNFGNCTETMINGEIGWNHDFKHPSMYPVNEFTSGQITDDKAAGRVYCTFEGQRPVPRLDPGRRSRTRRVEWRASCRRVRLVAAGAPLDRHARVPEHDDGDRGTDRLRVQASRDVDHERDVEHSVDVDDDGHVEDDRHDEHEVAALRPGRARGRSRPCKTQQTSFAPGLGAT